MFNFACFLARMKTLQPVYMSVQFTPLPYHWVLARLAIPVPGPSCHTPPLPHPLLGGLGPAAPTLQAVQAPPSSWPVSPFISDRDLVAPSAHSGHLSTVHPTPALLTLFKPQIQPKRGKYFCTLCNKIFMHHKGFFMCVPLIIKETLFALSDTFYV